MIKALLKSSLLTFIAASLLIFSIGTASAATTTLHAESLVSYAKRALRADPENWSFVFLGDNRGNDKKFREALQLAASFDPLFIIHGGDVAELGSADELEHFLDTVRSLPGLPPLFVVRGNHETDAALFEQFIGPLNFILDNKRLGFRLVAVDNAGNTLKERELAFLSNMLDKSRPNQFVAMHIPPRTGRWKDHSFATGRDGLVTLLADRKVKLGMFAHIHLFDEELINGVPCIISGGAGARLSYLGYTGTAKYHIVVVEVKKGKVTYRVEDVR